MKYKDQVYGEFEITEPIILELINSPSLQRLKDIDNYWLSLYPKPEIDMSEYDYNRFTHSIGVYLLLHKYSVLREEQIAGLIHDVSHSAFSHCIDYVLDSGSEKEHTHQDNIFNSYVGKTEIPGIFRKYNLDLDYILDDKNFPLKENNLPDLCADRIDNFLRIAVSFKEINEKDKNHLLENLTTKNNNWVFKNFESAKKCTELVFKLNKEYCCDLHSAIVYRTIGDCLKYALQKRYIFENDLYTTEKIVLEKLQKFLDKDEKLKLFWERMNNKIKITNNPNNFDVQVFCKSRVVDPLFKDKGTLKRVSEAESSWAEVVKQELKPKQYFLKFEK